MIGLYVDGLSFAKVVSRNLDSLYSPNAHQLCIVVYIYDHRRVLFMGGGGTGSFRYLHYIVYGSMYPLFQAVGNS